MASVPFARVAALALPLGGLLIACTTGVSQRDNSSSPPPPTTAAPAAMAAMSLEAEPEPPGGRPDVSAISDQVVFLQSVGYDVFYSETKRNPLVAEFFLRKPSAEDFEPCPRPSRFLTDERTAARVNHDDYSNTGYDRGHMAPNDAIATRHGCEAQKETFVMSNVAPQLPGLNQRTWQAFEKFTDDVYANEFDGVWILTGPVFDPYTVTTLCNTEIEVPVEFWKIVIRRRDDSSVDAAAFVMTQDERRSAPVKTFATTVDDVEARTGIDFFPDLTPADQETLEGACPGTAWHLDDQLRPTFPGTPRPICTTAPQSRTQPLVTTTGHSPACAQ